jgi:Uma2 family endonuclease
MTYTPAKPLTFEDLIAQYGDNTRYELIDGELRDMSPTGLHEAVAGRIAARIYIAVFRSNLRQPMFTGYQLVNGEYQQQQYRSGDSISSHLFPNLPLRLDDVMST